MSRASEGKLSQLKLGRHCLKTIDDRCLMLAHCSICLFSVSV